MSGGGRRRELDHTDILLDGNVRPVELTAMADGWAIASRRNATANSTKPSAWPYSHWVRSAGKSRGTCPGADRGAQEDPDQQRERDQRYSECRPRYRPGHRIGHRESEHGKPHQRRGQHRDPIPGQANPPSVARCLDWRHDFLRLYVQ